MAADVPGWTAPVFQSLAQTPLMAGVPMEFLVGDVLLICFLWLLWWPACSLGALAYGVAWLGTHYDVHFMAIFLAHLRQHAHYEG